MKYDEVWIRQSMQFEIKLLRDRVSAFESGEKYVQMEKLHKAAREGDFREMRRLREALVEARTEKHHVMEIWYQACEDIQNEYEKKLKEKEKEHARQIREKDELIRKLQSDVKKERDLREKEHEKYLAQAKEAYEAKTEAEDLKEKVQALTARINKDYSNSSKPSSMSPNHKTIQNGREKTGRSPGGQRGHVHHGRKRQEPTNSHEIPAPAKYLDDPNFKPTGRIIRKQLIKVHVVSEVIEYWTQEFRNLTTGQRVHAEFPPGIVDDVNYDGTVKALAYMINNDLYTSVDKTRVFLKDVSKGKIDISTGFICNLAKQFSECTKEEREEIFDDLMTAPILHADFTFGRAGGKQAAVIINATDDGKVMYQGRAKKGDEGVKGSPLEHYDGTLVSDHESALIKHGSRHQECLTHVDRYAKGADENEPNKKWPSMMHAWVTDSIHYWNNVNEGICAYDKETAEKLISEFMSAIAVAREEYEFEPPSKYNREGYNLYKRMEETPEDYVLFLRDPSVPPTNNIAERMARKFKRKAHQVMSFRSDEGVDRFCDGLSVIESIKATGKNLFEEITARFNKNIVECND